MLPDPKDHGPDYRAGYMAAMRDLGASAELIALQTRIFELGTEILDLKALRRVAVRIHGEPVEVLEIPNFLPNAPAPTNPSAEEDGRC